MVNVWLIAPYALWMLLMAVLPSSPQSYAVRTAAVAAVLAIALWRVRAAGALRSRIGLAEAAKNEAIFEFRDVRGDLVGFRLPGYVKGVNAPGWHLHFVDAERQHGGHVVNFSLCEGELRYCYANDFQIRLPDAATLAGLNLARDWSKELKRAEAER